MVKHDILNAIIEVEGGYVNDPFDSGGETNYGITKEVARANGYRGKMLDMTKPQAFDIYAAEYWDSVCADQILAVSETLAKEVVDTAINMGVNRAGTFLQRALNAFNDKTRLYSDVVVDGVIGPATLQALNAYANARCPSVLVRALNCLQGAYYIELAEKRAKDERFVYGWLKNRVEIT